jgi:zinc protease
MPALMFGSSHAYGQPLTGSGTEASVGAMTRADLARFHTTWFKPNHSTLIAVGDVALSDLVPRLEQAFVAWKPGDIPVKKITDVKAPDTPQLYLLDRPGAEQSVILVGRVVAPKANPDEHPFMAFNDAFGGSFSGRMNMNLREDKHWAYGAGSFAFDARGQRPWMIWAPVQTDKTKESLQEVLKEVREVMTSRPLSSAELDAAKDRLTRSLGGRWETNGAVAGTIEELVTFGLPDDYYTSFARDIRAVTPERVSAVVTKTMSADGLVIVVVGDRAKVERGLAELGLGALKPLDADGAPLGGGTP